MSYLKPVEFSSHIFYGVYSHQGEISNILHSHGIKNEDFFQLVYDNNLDYSRIGDGKRSNEYVIGKRIHSYRDTNVIKMLFVDNQMRLEYMNGKSPNIKLSNEEEREINSILLKIGFFPNSEYYLVNTYEAHLVNTK